MKRSISVLVTGAALLLCSCEKDPLSTNMGAWNNPATLEFTSETAQQVTKEENIAVFDFSSSQVVFDITSDRSWCTAYITDNNKLVVKVGENNFKNSRTATVTLKAGMFGNVSEPQSVTVTQGPGTMDIPEVGDIFDNGIVFWVQSAPYDAFRIMSLKKNKGGKWSDEQKLTSLVDKNDGAANVSTLKQGGFDITKYPAFQFCDTIPQTNGLGWYLPAENEFIEIMKYYNGGTIPEALTPDKLPTDQLAARNAFEALLAANGGDIFNEAANTANGDSYWISNENSDKNSWYVRVGSYVVGGGAKTSTARGARCVKYYDLR